MSSNVLLMPKQPLTLPFSGDKLRTLREKTGLTLQQFADEMTASGYPVHRTTIGKIERGDHRPPAPLLKALVSCLNGQRKRGDRIAVEDLLDEAAA